LSLNGVGFKFLEVNSNYICVKLGYSHAIRYYLPVGVIIKVSKRKPTKLLLFSPNKQLLSQVATIVAKMRNPDVYKAKGIQFFKEVIVLKKREKFGVF
jgi:large subunit ribosomal protein L6